MNFIPYNHSIKDFKIYWLSNATFCVELAVTLKAFITIQEHETEEKGNENFI